MDKKLFAIPYTDGRERKHVAAIRAATPEAALQALVAYQAGYEGFHYAEPTLRDVVVIDPDADGQVQILWHQDYD